MNDGKSEKNRTIKETLLYHIDMERAFDIDRLPLVETVAAASCPTAATDPFETLKAEALACTACPLHSSRRTVVFGEGDRHADLLFVGEAPGREEDLSGRPFIGRAGELLTKMIKAMKYERSMVFIANVLKCRPPDNRTPAADEISACLPFLREQISQIAPRVIVALGAPAARTLLEVESGISALRGRDYEYPGDRTIRVVPTFHPAYLLRNEEERIKSWHDLKRAMKLLDLVADTRPCHR
jgi:uracil-DNA glycosylase